MLSRRSNWKTKPRQPEREDTEKHSPARSINAPFLCWYRVMTCGAGFSLQRASARRCGQLLRARGQLIVALLLPEKASWFGQANWLACPAVEAFGFCNVRPQRDQHGHFAEPRPPRTGPAPADTSDWSGGGGLKPAAG